MSGLAIGLGIGFAAAGGLTGLIGSGIGGVFGGAGNPVTTGLKLATAAGGLAAVIGWSIDGGAVNTFNALTQPKNASEQVLSFEDCSNLQLPPNASAIKVTQQEGKVTCEITLG